MKNQAMVTRAQRENAAQSQGEADRDEGLVLDGEDASIVLCSVGNKVPEDFGG